MNNSNKETLNEFMELIEEKRRIFKKIEKDKKALKKELQTIFEDPELLDNWIEYINREFYSEYGLAVVKISDKF